MDPVSALSPMDPPVHRNINIHWNPKYRRQKLNQKGLHYHYYIIITEGYEENVLYVNVGCI